MTVIFHSEAETEIGDAIIWYERQQTSLASDFIRCTDQLIECIQQHPETYPQVYKHFRRALMRRFPFAVFYEVRESTIRILAVHHTRRHPSRWQNRK